jgi:hypothetical protein
MLYQYFLDIGRFSIGIVKHDWVHEKETVWLEQEEMPQQNPIAMLGRVFGIGTPPAPVKVQVKSEQTAYMGNRLTSVSPYNFFPDPRLPLVRFQEGEFCASEDEYSRSTLRLREAEGVYAGTTHVVDMRGEAMTKRGASRFSGATNKMVDGRSNAQTEATVIVTEVQVVLTPSKFILSDGEPMGASDQPEKWLVCYANDERIIRAEPLGYVHNRFTYTVGQFSPDQHSLISESISEMISNLQAVIDWFINSHITNVRKHISNRLVVDPVGVYFEDIQQHKAVIRLRPAAANSGVDRYVKQLTVSDVTQGHIQDVQTLMTFVGMTTAINDNAMGNYHTGRRSAREASNTSNASSQRLRTIVKIIFDSSLRPLGKDMLSNHRDGLTEEMFVNITGDEFPDWEGYNTFKVKDKTKVGVDRTKLAGRYDFTMFEGTLPSEKMAQAETLEKTLLALMGSPEGLPLLVQMLGYDPKKLFTEVLTLRGIKHPERFKINEVRLMEFQQAQQAQQMLENPPQPQPDPNGQPQPAGPGAGPAVAQPPVPPPVASFSSLVG